MQSPRSHGFTLIEIIVSVALLLRLSGLFIANYNGFNNSQTLRQSVSDLITNLQAARTMASAGVKPAGCDTLVGYIVNFSASTYTAQALCFVGSVGTVNTYTLPTGVTFPSPTPGAITFYALDRGASSAQTISLTGSGLTMKVSVFASGVVSDFVPTP
jgi:prepilin-type N-terminal cleavage/methylation domain-containing protein